MYNVKRSEGGLVTITEVGEYGDLDPMYTLGPNTLITFRMPGSDAVEMKQVKDFGSDTELLQAIAHKVRL